MVCAAVSNKVAADGRCFCVHILGSLSILNVQASSEPRAQNALRCCWDAALHQPSESLIETDVHRRR